MRLSNRFALFFLCLLLFLSGCGECSENSDCVSTNSCLAGVCSDSECKYEPIPNCKTNGICEDGTKGTTDFGENPCTAPRDCGVCKSTDPNLEASCEDNQCVTRPKASARESASGLLEPRVQSAMQYSMGANYGFDKPHNVDASLLTVDYSLNQIGKIKKVMIDKVVVLQHTGKKDRYGKYLNDNPIVIGEITSGHPLWQPGEKATISLPLSPKDLKEGKYAIVTHTSYIGQDNRGMDVKRTFVHEDDVTLSFIDPTLPGKCPDFCDDSNPCTLDACSESTGFFCQHTMKPNCAGNFVCDAGENKCNAPLDCGPCEGSAGQFTTYACSADKVCKGKLIGSTTPKRVDADGSLPSQSRQDFRIKSTYEFTEPFALNTPLKITIELLSISKRGEKDAASDIKINRIQLVDKSTVLGEASGLSIGLSSVGQSQSIELLPSFGMKMIEEKRAPSVKIYYNYNGLNTKGEPATYSNQIYQYSLGQTTFADVIQ